MSRHTPGPWKLDATGGSPARITDATGETIAMVYLTDPATRKRDDAHAANARLLAAAPEMVAALEKVAYDSDRPFDSRDYLLQKITMDAVIVLLARVRGAA